ncbi:Sieve element occlusion, partial [Parasponia andersonii]
KTSPFKSEETIAEQIKATHTPDPKDSFEVNSLFTIVVNILNRSTQIVDKVLNKDASNISENEHMLNKPEKDFTVPIRFLKIIGCELYSCKVDPGAEKAHKTALKILEKLKKCSWKAKAVLTLAVFAKEFSDFSQFHLVEFDPENTQDQLTKSLAILKGSPIFGKTSELPKEHKTAVEELNKLVKGTIKMMETINELENPSIDNKRKEITDFIHPEEVDYYWVIMAVIACANKVTILTTSDEDKPPEHDLYPYDEKVQNLCTNLSKKLEALKTGTEEEVHYYKLLKLSKCPTRVVEFLELLFDGPHDSAIRVQLIDGSDSDNTFEIDELKKKKKLLFVFSRPERKDISKTDILDIMKRIQSEKIKKTNKDGVEDEHYAIVWVPIADENRSDQLHTLRKEFETMLRSNEIQCYTVNNFAVSKKGSLKFLKENWHFETTPIGVVMDLAQGKIENVDAFYTARLWGLDAFPFDKESLEIKRREMSFLFRDCPLQSGDLANWVQNNEYIIFHGGTDQYWGKEIEEKVNLISKEVVKIEHLDVNQENVVEVKFKNLFWNVVNDLISTERRQEQVVQYDFAKQQLERLSSFKQARGWFVLNKGPTTVVVGSRETFLKVMEKFDEWKKTVQERTLEVAFKENHEKIFYSLNDVVTSSKKESGELCIIEYPTADGKLRIKMDCPKCQHAMERNISVTYK